MPIPKATPEVCDKPADDYAYALMIGCIQSGFSFLGPFKAEDEALQAWDEHLETLRGRHPGWHFSAGFADLA